MLELLVNRRWRTIMVGIFMALAPLLALALFVRMSLVGHLVAQSNERRMMIAQAVVEILKGDLEKETLLGQAYAVRPLLVNAVSRGDRNEMLFHLKSLVETSSALERAFIASPQGILLQDYPTDPSVIGKEFSWRDWYQGVSRTWTPYVSEFYQRQASPRRFLFAIAVPIKAPEGKVVGILVMQPGADFIGQVIAKLPTAGGIFYVVDRRGQLIYHSCYPGGTAEEETVDLSKNPVVGKVGRGLSGTEKGFDPETGEPVNVAYAPLVKYGLGVVTVRSLAEILAPVDSLFYGLATFAGVMGLIAVLVGWCWADMLIASQAATARLRQEEIVARARQQELDQTNRRLEEVSRAKSDFLANMSHELRTPLNSVIGFTEVLQDQLFGPVNAKQQEYLHDIEDSGKHLLELINDILDLAKVEAGKMELDLGHFLCRDLLQATQAMLKEKVLKNGITFAQEISIPVDLVIEADERKVKQIMFNLLSNAVKFTPAGGRVCVAARVVASPPGVSPGQDEDWLEVSVADSGIGIRPEDLDKLFKAFSQLESAYTKNYQGTGLGLALTRQLVELHGGKIQVESEFGRGSRFWFTIPLKQSPK